MPRKKMDEEVKMFEPLTPSELFGMVGQALAYHILTEDDTEETVYMKTVPLIMEWAKERDIPEKEMNDHKALSQGLLTLMVRDLLKVLTDQVRSPGWLLDHMPAYTQARLDREMGNTAQDLSEENGS